MKPLSLCLVLTAGLCLTPSAGAAEKTAAERGQLAVRGLSDMNPQSWSKRAYDEVWKRWGVKEKPADYGAAFRERYGLQAAPYDNGGLPMGMHVARGGKGLTVSCVLCHAGTVAGQTVIGLGNASLDLQGLFEEMFAAEGGFFVPPYQASLARGTIDPVGPILFLMEFRDPDLNLRSTIKLDRSPTLASDPPAWWLLKKKKTRNWTGGLDARSARVDMATLLHPLNSPEHIKKQEGAFADIHAFVMSTQPPAYPFPVDRKLAEQGKGLFERTCARCHGTYGADGTYPNKVVPLDALGTDPLLARSLTKKNVDYFNRSWFTQQKGPDGKPYQISETEGYQAPPLDGVWATAPYFHNGSAPTVYHVLNSKARPRIFTRSYKTDRDAYDPVKLGWKVTVLEKAAAPNLPGVERRRIYDTTRPGQSNGGHVYGDKLTEDERRAVIEYLKTL